jgi:F0F1-type ATP synthase membrane subunit b/b'
MLMNTLVPLIASVQIDVDVTVAIQFVTFTVALFSIWGLIITPYLKAREARDEGTSGSREEADEMEAMATARLAEYDERMTQIRRESMETREELRAAGAKTQQDLLGAARAEISAKSAAEQKKIAEKVSQVEVELDARAKKLAELMIQKILPTA